MTQKIDRMNPEAITNIIRPELAKAIAVLEQYGLSVRVGNAAYTDTTVTLKVECAVRNADGTAQTRESESFKQMAQYIDLEASDLFQTYGGYKIMGYNGKARKYPIIAQKVADGKTYKFTVKQIVRYKEQALASA